ncbi:beta-ketoacyl-ACP synthase II [Bengtsoniella intestinalis]|uniref:beta-ketoacyl-ACP synthase II n=1 Tax=Bengtsoniella intestinalis TaxID=3073143 RepID=UPI00391FCA0C
MKKRTVVITGMGAITPLGHTAQDTWQAMKSGTCGIAPITLYDTKTQKVTLAAEVKDFAPEQYLDKRAARNMARFTQFAMVAAKEAIADCGFIPTEALAHRCGVIVSSGIGSMQSMETEHSKGLEKGFDRVSPYFIPMTICNMAAGQIAIEAGYRGLCTCPVTACAGGTNAIGDGFRAIRDGYADVMLCGGSEAAITPLAVGGFTSLKALATTDDVNRASIPFDAERSGFVMGEGAAMLILEELEHAKARGAKIYATVEGYGATCDAHHITAPRPDGSGGAMAMQLALDDAGISPEQVAYINAHGTSTHLNDAGETAAVKAVFGDHAHTLAVSSTKSMTGHLLGAAGAVEGMVTALSLQDGFIPATINLQQPDPDCDLDYVPNQGRTASIRYAMSNSLGFGGHNASILLGKWEG